MILLPQMHQLVNEHVIANLLGHLHQAKVQRDLAGARARSPPRTLISDADTTDVESVLSCQIVQSWHKLGACHASKIILHERTQALATVERDAAIGIAHDAGWFVDGQGHEPATKHDRSPVFPLTWCVLNPDATPLSLDPPAILAQECFRLATRPPTRHCDAQRAIWLNAENVAPGARHSDEVDFRKNERLRCRLSLTLWSRPWIWDACEWKI